MMPEKVDNVQQTLDALRSVVDLTDDDIAAFRKERARSHRFTSIPVKTNSDRSTSSSLCRQSVPFSGCRS